VSRIPQVVVNPESPMSIVDHLYRVGRVVDGRLEFGSPQDPADPTSVTVADGVTHNGTVLNMAGSWFSGLITAVGRSNLTCVHNLNTPTTAGLVPVRWQKFGWSHNGTGGGAATELDLALWYMGGAVTANSIVLAASVNVIAGALTINAGNPLRVDLFFVGAVR
jgi:hypothetical protein